MSSGKSLRRRFIMSGAASAVIAVFAGPDYAQAAGAYSQGSVRIGYAILAERDVFAVLYGQQQKLFKQDDIHENAFIRTQRESAAHLLFVDKAQLILGPMSTAKLDRLMYNPDKSVKELAVGARTGPVRWISGNSDSSAYQIEASTVIVRPHGTIFDLVVEPQRTTVVLREGIIEACLIDVPQRCRVLSRPGEMITATRTEITAPQPSGLGASEFEERCLSAASKGCPIGSSAASEPRSPKPKKGADPSQPKPQKVEPPPKKKHKEAYVEPPPKKKYKEAYVEPPLKEKQRTYERPIIVTEAPPRGPEVGAIAGAAMLGVLAGTYGSKTFHRPRPYYGPKPCCSGGYNSYGAMPMKRYLLKRYN